MAELCAFYGFLVNCFSVDFPLCFGLLPCCNIRLPLFFLLSFWTLFPVCTQIVLFPLSATGNKFLHLIVFYMPGNPETVGCNIIHVYRILHT